MAALRGGHAERGNRPGRQGRAADIGIVGGWPCPPGGCAGAARRSLAPCREITVGSACRGMPICGCGCDRRRRRGAFGIDSGFLFHYAGQGHQGAQGGVIRGAAARGSRPRTCATAAPGQRKWPICARNYINHPAGHGPGASSLPEGLCGRGVSGGASRQA